jgi:hypothetical protein
MISDNKQLIPVDSRELIVRSLNWCASITEIRINDEPEYIKACETTRQVKTLLRDIDDDLHKNTDPIAVTLDEIRNHYRPVVKALTNLKDNLLGSTSTYEKDQARKRLEAQRAADEKVKKDREDLQKLADKENKKAEKAEAAGDIEKAEDHRTQAITISQIAATAQASPPPPPPPKIEGKTNRDHWEGRVINPRAFIEYCLQNDELQYIKIDQSALNKLAVIVKDQKKIPGVVFENNPVQSYRRK